MRVLAREGESERESERERARERESERARARERERERARVHARDCAFWRARKRRSGCPFLVSVIPHFLQENMMMN